MYEDFAPRLARVLTEYSIPVQPGDLVGITGPVGAQPLIEALYIAVLERGGHPEVAVQLPRLEEIRLARASDAQLDYVSPTSRARISAMNITYSIGAPENTRALAHIDPTRKTRVQQAAAELNSIFWERHTNKSLRWNISPWPTNAAAQEAEMGLFAYTGFVYRACGLDQPDPVAYWQAVRERQLKLADHLAGTSRVEVTGPGINLRFSVAGRTWCSSHGEVNMPDGELYISPVEDSMEGQVAFDFPTVYGGQQINGVKLAFEKGVVVEASAEKGEGFLLGQIDLDAGARCVGEFAIGMNEGIQQFTGSTLFDEKIGGTIHIALGNSYTETGGQNESVLHWDMVHGMRNGGEIRIDGELVYQNGAFTVS